MCGPQNVTLKGLPQGVPQLIALYISADSIWHMGRCQAIARAPPLCAAQDWAGPVSHFRFWEGYRAPCMNVGKATVGHDTLPFVFKIKGFIFGLFQFFVH